MKKLIFLYFILLFVKTAFAAEAACGFLLSTALPKTAHHFSEIAIACEDSVCNQKGTERKEFPGIQFGGNHLLFFKTQPLEDYKKRLQKFIQESHCPKECVQENFSLVDMSVEPKNPSPPPPECKPEAKAQKAIEYTVKFNGKTCTDTEEKVADWIKGIAMESNKEGQDLDKKTPDGCSITADQSTYSHKTETGCETTAVFKAKFTQLRSDYNFKASATVTNQWVCKPKGGSK